jgi:hypothetical protein
MQKYCLWLVITYYQSFISNVNFIWCQTLTSMTSQNRLRNSCKRNLPIFCIENGDPAGWKYHVLDFINGGTNRRQMYKQMLKWYQIVISQVDESRGYIGILMSVRSSVRHTFGFRIIIKVPLNQVFSNFDTLLCTIKYRLSLITVYFTFPFLSYGPFSLRK